MQNTQAINVQAGNATATGSVTVSDNMPAIPCPDPAGYKYVGARYVPLFAEPAEWNINSTYEPLTIVLHEGNSYTSKQYVPVGIQIDNEEYWALTGNYNAQVEQYRKEVKTLAETLEKYTTNNSVRLLVDEIDVFNNISDANLAVASTKNASVIQALIDEGITVVLPKGFIPIESPIVLNTGSRIEGMKNNTTLVGKTALITFGNGEVNSCVVKNMNISNTGVGACIDFTYNKSTTNIYWCVFEGLKCSAADGNCVEAGKNTGATGDTLFFNSSFIDVGVNAPGHYGFNGISSIVMLFDRIYDLGKIDTIFYNTFGEINNFNGTFAGAEWFMQIDENVKNSRVAISIKNSNIEDFKQGFIYNKNVNAFTVSLHLEYVNFYHTKASSLKNIHPLYLQNVESVYLSNYSEYYPPSSSWSDIYSIKESTLYCNMLPSTTFTIDTFSPMPITILTSSNIVYTVNGGERLNFSALNPSDYGLYWETNETHSKAFVGGSIQAFKNITDSDISSTVLNLKDNRVYDGVIFTGANTTIAQVVTNSPRVCKPFVIANNGDGTLTIANTPNVIVTKSGSNVSLSKGKYSVFISVKVGTLETLYEVANNA